MNDAYDCNYDFVEDPKEDLIEAHAHIRELNRQHAAEIARLRLTDEEREAVKLATNFLEDEFYGCSDKCAAEHNAVVTLRKLLKRLA